MIKSAPLLPFSLADYRDAVIEVVKLAETAADIIMAVYQTAFSATEKADGSPVTIADTDANDFIVAGLQKHFPYPIIAEESVAAGGLPKIDGDTFWLVDPLDGTKEFLLKNDEFTVNIALIHQQQPVLGVISAPALHRTYRTLTPACSERRVNNGDWEPISARAVPRINPVIIASRSHRNKETDLFIKTCAATEVIAAGSSLKFCRLAEGVVDIYPKFGPTMEWDTAAGQAILVAAGGRVLDPQSKPILYQKPGYHNSAFIAYGRAILP